MFTSYLNRFGAIDFSRTLERLTDGFVGREWLFQKLDDWLNQESGEKFYLLTGEPGVGKSAIAAQLIQRWADKENEPVKELLAAYHFCRAGDVETVRPGRVLRSLATQLGKTLPHYGEALKEVLDPIYLHINSEINIGTLSNSEVTGIYVENLKDLDPREEFRLLIQAPLAALSNIYTTLGETPPALKIFLIDSLDEAATTTGRENMMTLLASLYQARETLPHWVRFLLTARPHQDVLNRFLPLQSEKIEELEKENLSDIQRYVQERIDRQLWGEPSTPEPQINNAIVSNSKPLQQRLDAADITAEKLVQEVRDLSKGNFLYTKLLLNSIASGEQSIKNLAALPKDLNDIYHRTLRYRCSFRGWLKRYQPILGTLSVTQEPISQEQLGKLIGIKTEVLKKDLDVFRQFLDESKDEHGQVFFTIFHQSLREYLLDKTHNHDFWCDKKEQHDGIIKCFENESDGWQDLRAIDLYGSRHLAQHLVQGGQQDELHTLLTRENADRRNAWFDAKDSKNDTLGFLTDVALAWQIAEEEFSTSQSSQSIVLQCRYALITSSINSLAGNLPTELVIELVKQDTAKGWDYFRQLIFSQQVDLQILSKLEFQKPKLELLQKLLQIVEIISNKSYQAQIKSALARYYSSQELLEVLELVKAIKAEEDKSQALKMLVPYLSLEQQLKALEIAEGISDQFNRAKTLIILSKYLQYSRDLLVNVLEISQKADEVCRTRVLTELAPYLPDDLLTKALEIALDVNNPQVNQYLQACSLCGIATAPRLNKDLIEKIQKKAENFEQNFQTLVLSALLPHLLPEQQGKILEKVQALETESYKYKALEKLAPHLHSEQLQIILQEVQTFKDESIKSQFLAVSLQYLTSEQLQIILQEVQTFKDEHSKISALKGLVASSHLTKDLIENIWQMTESFQHKDSKTQVLSALAPNLTLDQIYKTLQELQTVEDDYEQTRTIRNLLAQLPSDQLHQVFHEGELTQEVKAIDSKYYEILTPSERTICLPSDQLYEILQVVQAYDNEYDKALSLKGIATTPNLTADLIENIQLQIESFQKKGSKTQVMSALAPHLPSIRLPRILQEVQTIEDEYDKTKCLNALAFHLPSDQLHQILQEIRGLNDKSYKIQVLGALAFRLLSDQLPKQIHEEHRIQVVNVLTPHLPSDQLCKVLQEVRSLGDHDFKTLALRANFKALALSALAPHLSADEILEMLKVTQAIQDEFARADALRVLALALAKLSHADLHPLWSEMLHTFASRDRRNLLSDFRELTPVIFSLGKDEAIVGLCHAIQNIGRQWS